MPGASGLPAGDVDSLRSVTVFRLRTIRRARRLEHRATATIVPRRRLVLKTLARPRGGLAAALLALLLGTCLGLGVGVTRALAAPSLPELRAKADRLRAKLDAQNQRLEIIAEDLDAAYQRGTELLASSTALARRRDAARRAVQGASADRDSLPMLAAARARLDALDDALGRRLKAQARLAMRLKAEQDEARALIADLKRELRTMDRRVAALIAEQRRREEAQRQAAFARWMAQARPGGAASGPAAAIARRAVGIALAQLGSPYQWGAEGPDAFDCSGLTSFAYHAAGLDIPRVSRAQYAAYRGARAVGRADLRPGDLVFFATDPGNPGTIHHVGMYIGRGLMVEAPHTGAVVRTASVWRSDYAGAVRPVAAP
jgi:cell wall-associated NlpC family hydrolase